MSSKSAFYTGGSPEVIRCLSEHGVTTGAHEVALPNLDALPTNARQSHSIFNAWWQSLSDNSFPLEICGLAASMVTQAIDAREWTLCGKGYCVLWLEGLVSGGR